MPLDKLHEKQKLTPLESIGIGFVTGFVGATVYLPFWSIKMRYQCGFPFSLHPFILFKGYTTILGVMVPITGLQLFNASRVEHLTEGQTVSYQQRMASAFIAGASSATISNILNLLGTQQHKHKYISPFKTAQTLVMNHGLKKLTVGLLTTTMAEGLFTFSYYGLVPFLKSVIKDYVNNDFSCSLIAGGLAGITTSIITQPLDRIKTLQHQRVDENDHVGKYKHGLVASIKDLYSKDGFRIGFFKGLIPRGVGLTATIAAAGATAEFTENIYRKYIAPKLS